MRISELMLKKYVSYKVAPGYYSCLNEKGKDYYRRKLAKDIVKGRKISLRTKRRRR